MRRIVSFSLTILLVSLALLGCQQQDTPLDAVEEIKEVQIFKTSAFDTENSDLIVASSATEHTEIFETVKSILSDAVKQDGVVDVAEPNYSLEIIYENNQTKELYLWLLDAESGKGSLMEVEDTHTIYLFSEELNAQLIQLIDTVKE